MVKTDRACYRIVSMPTTVISSRNHVHLDLFGSQKMPPRFRIRCLCRCALRSAGRCLHTSRRGPRRRGLPEVGWRRVEGTDRRDERH
jgi:hypothetical protein